MFYETMIETPDRSFYTDKLEALTGKPRIYWSRFPLWLLQRFYAGEIRRKERCQR